MNEKKKARVRISEVLPADIVDVWRLFDNSNRLSPQNYPSLEEEAQDALRAHLFAHLAQPDFLGVIARIGKRPVGQLNGFIRSRPYGAPRIYYQFWLNWVEPECRKQGIAQSMLREIFAILKKRGIHHCESLIDPEMIPQMEKVYGGQLKVVSHRIIFKVKVE